MLRCQGLFALLCTVLCGALQAPSSSAADKESQKTGKVAGILIDKQEKWLTVKADGEDEPVKYLIPESDKKLTQSLKNIYNASRVQLTYKTDGEDWQLTSIRKQILRRSGTVTGTVVKVYNNFWVEVKTRDGVSDAYAPNGTNYKNKAFMDLLTGLKPGDSVTIRFTTDGERHRIEALRKN